MPATTIRPVKQSPNYKRVAVTGTSAAATAVADSSDATYIRRKAAKSPLARFVLAAPTIPAGSDIATIVPGARLKQPTSRAPRLVTLAMSVWGTGKPASTYPPTINGPTVRAGSGTVAYTYQTPAGSGVTAAPNGPWAAVLSALAVRVNDGHAYTDSNRATIYEVFADVYYSARPSASIAIAPSSPVTTTSYPELTATLSALVESWQDGSGPAARAEVEYELKVFTAAQVAAGGFDPAITAPVWSTQGITAPLDYIDGVTISSEDVAETPDSPLVNGTYRAYARGRRMFAAAEFGSWATLDFVIAVTPPTSPTISASRDDAAALVTITVTPVTSAGATSPFVSLERSADAGATWAAVRDATRVAGTFAMPIAFEDYEAPRGVALEYRASVEATISGQQLVSAWASSGAVPALSADGWNLKAPADSSLNVIGVRVNADPEWQQDEDTAVFRPVGRSRPIVVSTALGGADGTLTITTDGDTEWSAIEALREHQGALLLESPFGWSRYIRIVSRSWSEGGSAGAPRRILAVSFLEVEAPA